MKIITIIVALFVSTTVFAQTTPKPAAAAPKATAPATTAKPQPPRPTAAKPTVAKVAPAAVVEAPIRKFGNADVIKLKAADFTEQQIADAITAAPNKEFDITADGLIALKTAGVSKPIIDMVLGKPYAPEAPAAPTNLRIVEAPAPAPPATTPAPAPDSQSEQKRGFFGNLVKTVAKVKDVRIGDSNSVNDEPADATAGNAPKMWKLKDGESAAIRTNLTPDQATTKLIEYFNSKDQVFLPKVESGVITTDWGMNRGCGIGFNKCENKARVAVTKDASGTVLNLQVVRRKREAGLTPKNFPEDNKINGDETSKMANEIEVLLNSRAAGGTN